MGASLLPAAPARAGAPLRALAGSVLALSCLCLPVLAQDDKPDAAAEAKKKEQDLQKKTLPLRTALYHDPTLGSPMERLLELYRKANRAEELLGLYRTHLSHYPRDAGARTVLARLLLMTNDPGAEAFVRRAVGAHPKHSYLRFLLFTILSQENDPRALTHLDQAIDLEVRPTRKRTWIRLLLKQAINHDQLTLARKHLKGYAALLGGTPEALLAAARKMHELKLYPEALGEVAKAKAKSPSPETGVELDLFAASVEVSQKKHEAAAKRLDALLGRLTADYWRRPEILRRRARLIRSPEAREALVKKARAAWQANMTDEAAALDLARLLAGFDRHRAALDTVLASSKKLPSSIKLEKEALALFDRLREERGREAYLAERIAANPERLDLKDQRMRSLFMLGKRPEGLAVLKELTAPMSKDDKVKRYLETARYLRGQAFPSFAADVFGRAVELAPERLDLRRELAETHLASGDRSAAHRVLNVPVPRVADTALLLDLVQLMTREELYSATRRAIGVQLEKRPDHFQLLLALLEVEGRMGNGASGKTILARTRKLADNKSRYRRWLEQAVAFYDMFDATTKFLTEEQKRLSEEQGPWNKRRLERLLTFTDLNSQHHRGKEVAAMLAGFLKLEGLPKKVQIELRRQMVGGLEDDPTKQGEAETELKALSKADPERDNEYRARLAALYLSKRRPDQARPLLKGIRIGTLNDAGILSRLERAFTELNQTEQVAACLARLAQVDPANKANWERWVEALAARGEERRLRAALRRILRGGPKLKIKAKIRRLLRTHLADSYWRSVGVHLSRGTEVASLEALSLLDQVERTTEIGDAWVWIMFARAHAHNVLGRTKARDAALAELERAYAKLEVKPAEDAAEDGTKPKAGKTPPKRAASRPISPPPVRFGSSFRSGRSFRSMPFPVQPAPAVRPKVDPNVTALPGKHLRFPDGLSASREAVRGLLSKPYDRVDGSAPLADRHGPTPPLRVQWAFETYGHAAITGVFVLDATRILVSDRVGNLYGVDRATGKLSWGLPNTSRSAPRPPQQTGFISGSTSYRPAYGRSRSVPHAAIPVVAPDGRFFVGEPGALSCYGPDGKHRWRVTLVKNGSPLLLRVHAGRLLGFEPRKGLAVGIDLETAKVAWLTQLPETPQFTGQYDPNTGGVAVGGGRFFVYGDWAAILNAKTGAVLWSFEPHRVRKLPVKLSPSEEGWGAPPPLGNPYIARRRYSSFSSTSNRRYTDRYLSYLDRTKQTWSPKAVTYGSGPATTTIVAPAAQWATQRYSGQVRRALLAGNRLLLFQAGANPTGVYATDLRLPLFGKLIGLSGTPLGVHGTSLVLLDGHSLNAYDLTSGELRAQVQLSAIGQHPKGKVLSTPRLNASIDPSGTATITGPGGVMTVSLARMRTLFVAPWPAIVQPDLPKTQKVVNYTFAGVHERDQAGYYGSYLHYDPLVGLSSEGVLFAPTDSWRLVALRRDGGD